MSSDTGGDLRARRVRLTCGLTGSEAGGFGASGGDGGVGASARGARVRARLVVGVVESGLLVFLRAIRMDVLEWDDDKGNSIVGVKHLRVTLVQIGPNYVTDTNF